MTENRLIRFFIVMLVIQILPVLFLGDNAYIRIHDTLEGELNWYHMLKISGTGLDLSKDAIVPQIMNGQYRITLHSPVNLTYWFMQLLGIYWGYQIQKIFLVLIAFLGMFLFVRDEVRSSDRTMAFGIAVIYSWIPFYSVFGCTFAGIPLAVWSFRRILRSSANWYHYAIILFFPFWSSIVWAAPSILLLFLALTIRNRGNRRVNTMALVIMALMSGLYILANFQLISSLIAPPDGFISHREGYDFKNFKPFSFGGSLAETVYSIFLGHYHIGTFFTGLIWMTVLAAYFSGRKIKRDLVISILALSVFIGFYGLIIMQFSAYLSLVETFRFERIRMLLPFLNLLLFASALTALARSDQWKSIIQKLIVLQLLITVFLNDEFIHNLRHLSGNETKPAFREYFDMDLLKEIDHHIDKDLSSYRIIHLGINPAISQHYGFYTLDGLLSIYTLDHKDQFRRIITEELAKDESLDRYFTLWGNRCYMFSAELGKEDGAFLVKKDSGTLIQSLDVDSDVIREMGGRYVFSGLPVQNAASLGWDLEGIFETDESYYRIYLYSL